ncbi:hypothetical protein GCM10009751_34810 [Myceligenerans crystallogenes]|uniref:Solute-binding protein family 3/N-terminal domain-containing protein n=1 Tax=Myceligenerans crystallogenes TaxID=316335 RepID=A0ABN2NL20_9MICO
MIGALALAGCGGGTTGGTETGGADAGTGDPGSTSLTIGIANEQPYGYMGDDGEATGFDPEITRQVLVNLGYSEENLEFRVVEFGQLIGGLQAGQFDLVAAGMYINPERLEQVLFTDPDYCTYEGLAVAEGNPEDIADYQSFTENPDLTIAVATGTVEEGYAKDAGIPAEQIESFPGIDQMYEALAAGEVDAVTGTAATVNTHVAATEGIEAVEPFFPEDAEGNETLPCGGIAFAQDDGAFRDEFNEELNTLREDGTTTEIITSYEDQDGNPYFTEQDVETANELTVDDFRG